MPTPERTLAIECATEACSVALFESGTAIAAEHRLLGRGHAEHLVPMIAALPDRGRATKIVVSLGPGSFTGVRIGIAVAGALAIAWQAELAGYPTLALVAAMALDQVDAEGVTVCMAGGHGEWFVQDFGAHGVPATPLASLAPETAARRSVATILAGNRAMELASLLKGQSNTLELLPEARKVSLLAPAVLLSKIAPIYGRAPDARMPA